MKILITRPRAQADDFAEKLHSAGFEPIFFPVIKIQPIENNVALERAYEKLNCYEWVVFTSVNAVDVVLGQPESAIEPQRHAENGNSLRLSDSVSTPRFAVIGPKTAEALRKYGIEPDFVPEEYVAEAILPGLGDLQGKWVLLPRAEIARQALPEAIANAGGIAHEIVVYQTLPAQVDEDGLSALKSGVDVITFTSASTVENFVAISRQHNLDPLNLPNNPFVACIGPITQRAAKEAGFQNRVIAKEYTTDGLIEAIAKMEKS